RIRLAEAMKPARRDLRDERRSRVRDAAPDEAGAEAERGIPDACRTRDARRVGGPPSISESRPAAAIATRAASAKPFSADLRPGLEPRLERRGELANRQAPHRLAALLELLVIDGHHPSAANVQTVVAIAAIGQ